jgi:hypothetical protein
MNQGPGFLQKGDDHKNAKSGMGPFKNILLKNQKAR